MKIQVEQVAVVEITVKDGSDAVTRITGPDGNAWRADLYPLHTAEDVFEMWADNAVRNGVRDANRLDGWGDLEDGEVTMDVVSSEMDRYQSLGGAHGRQ